MPGEYDSNALWVSVNEQGVGDIFGVYPKVLAEILHEDDEARIPEDTSEAEKLVLPSDWDWRQEQYFMLIALQKPLDLSLEVAVKSEGSALQLVKPPPEPWEEWAPWKLTLSTRDPTAPAPVSVRSTQGGEPWDIVHVLKAGQLLMKPPVKVTFQDEHEMRQVYSVIYDVFRYKAIMNQAIDDVRFFVDYNEFLPYRPIVWLFLLELARRRWEARPRGELDRINEQLERTGYPFYDIEQTIWQQKVHFAAAIARIRIKNKAFDLSELLPPHLREARVGTCATKETVTGWVNTFKAKKIAALVQSLSHMGYSYSNSRTLCAGEYRFDRVCPRFITLRPPANVNLKQLDLVRDGIIVLQEREFCEGASVLCRALREHDLRGVVAQTHASSPRCSAYLAAQLRELAAVLKATSPAAPIMPQLGKLVVFGAGEGVESYVESLKLLGIDAAVAPETKESSVCVYSESVHCNTPAVESALDGVVAVLATPPNSYSAVTDPIDLVCGRGGDLALLEILTETTVDKAGKARVQSILEEQKKTLRTLLSKPQIQLVLYETHSSLEAENQAQVTRAVAEANRLAREKHSIIKKKTMKSNPSSAKIQDEIPSQSTISLSSDIIRQDSTMSEKGIEADGESQPKKIKPLASNQEFVLRKIPDIKEPDRRTGSGKDKPIPAMPNTQNLPEDQFPRDPDKDSADIEVPNCDLFMIGTLPTIGNGLDLNYILDRDGCYLGLIRRKEITRLNARYMIKVAEDRGLFEGAPSPVVTRRRKPEPHTTSHRRRRRNSGFEVERVAAPTLASAARCRHASANDGPSGTSGPEEGHGPVCERHLRRQAAASALVTSCVCDAHHRPHEGARRASTASATARAPSPPCACRRPFPITVNTLTLLPVRDNYYERTLFFV